MKKRFAAIILCVAMIALMMPNVALAAGTDAIQLGAGGIVEGSKVYFGKKGTTVVPWIALDDNGFLLSEYTIGNSNFRENKNGDYGYYNYSTTSNSENSSKLKTAMDGLYRGEGTTLFSELEQCAIKKTSIDGGSMYSGMQNVDAYLFPLSHSEVQSIGSDNPLLKAKSIDAPQGAAGLWWLRSSYDDFYAYCADVYGIHYDANSRSCGVRPAFHLDRSSVLFISAAIGWQPDGELTSISYYNGNEWKLTIKDSSRNFTAVTTKKNGDVLTVFYSDASTGTNEYISAIVKDSSGSITHYGRLKNTVNAADSDGTVEIDLSGIDMTNKQLYVFSEQFNGTYHTDYASPLKAVATDIGASATAPQLRINSSTNEWEVSYDDGATWTSLGVKATGEAGADGREIELQVANGYIQWRYTGGTWANLIALAALKGADGSDGADGITPQLRISSSSGEWEISYDNGTTYTSLGVKATGADGKDGITPQLRINASTNYWEVSYDDGVNWTTLGIKATGENGTDGREIELRVEGDYIQWRYTGGTWANLIALTALKGADGGDGTDGITPQLKIGTDNYWYVSYDDGETWTSLGVMATGNTGASGQNGTDGTDGKNGRDGRDGAGGKAGKDGITPQLRINDTTNEWEVSYDSGKNWISMSVKATGENGKDGVGISDIRIDENGNYVFTMSDGSIINTKSYKDAVPASATVQEQSAVKGIPFLWIIAIALFLWNGGLTAALLLKKQIKK